MAQEDTQRVYKHYDQAELDAQYNNRARVEDFDAVLDAWRGRSEQLRQRRDGLFDLPYGDHPRHRLDYFPAVQADSASHDATHGAAQAPPLLLFVHGGYWLALDSATFHFLAEDLLDSGISVAFASYPLAPADDMDTIAKAPAQALDWLRQQARELHFDPRRLVVAGHSAGGHLAALSLVTPPRDDALPRAVLALSGLFDLEPLRRSYFNAHLHLTPEQVRLHSPVYLPPQAVQCPLLLAVGDEEPAEYHAQSAALARAWGDRLPITTHRAPRADHFTVLETLLDAESVPRRWLRRQVQHQLHPRPPAVARAGES